MKQHPRIFARALLACLCLGLTGCSLLPQEEEYAHRVSFPAPAEEAAYSLVRADIGDVVVRKKLSVTYQAVERETLAFSIGGVFYDRSFVEKGDRVEEGQLLLKLDTRRLDEDIAREEESLARLTLLEAQLQEELAFTLQREAERSALTGRDWDEEAVRARYAGRLSDLAGQIQVAELKLEQLLTQREGYLLRAPFSGTVTYLAAFTPLDVSVEGRRMVQVSDLEHSVFTAQTEFGGSLSPEAEYVVESSGGQYPVRYLPPEEGVQASSGKIRVSFQLLTPDAELQENTTGSLVVTLDARQGVLRVPNGAVVTAMGQTYVYVPDEAGLRTLRPVEIGLVGDGYTQILSGLSEGELVIQ